MSIGPLGMIGSLAGSQLAQTHGNDAARTPQEVAAQKREMASLEKAEQAAGIGHTTEEMGTGDRDADGRRLWEAEGDDPQHPRAQETDPSTASLPPGPRSAGERGANLDLQG